MRRLLVALLVVGRAAPSFASRYGCDATVHQVEWGPTRLGMDVALGGQRSAAPVSGLATSLALVGDRRLRDWLSIGARAAWLRGGDAGIDANGDGRDDRETGAVSHLLVTAGPRLRLSHIHASTFWELDAGAGYLAPLWGGGEGGPAGEVGLSFANDVSRLSLRVVQGSGAADSYRAVLFGFGVSLGGAPSYEVIGGCDYVSSDAGAAFAIGVHPILSGWGLGHELGYLAPGLAIEVPYYLRYPVDLVARWDVLVFPRGDRDAQTDQSVLAGVRAAIPISSSDPYPHVVLQAQLGWTFVTATMPTVIDSGPIADVGAGLAMLTRREGMFVRLHARLGLGSQDRELRALFLSVGYEYKHASGRWYRHRAREM